MNASRPFGAFGRGVFQIGYVTADLGRAMHVLKSRHGIQDFLCFSADLGVLGSNGRQEKLVIDVAHSFVGNTHIEVIQPKAGCIPIYDDYVPRGEGDPLLRQHHLAMLVPEDSWEEFYAGLRTNDTSIVMENQPDYVFNFCYIDDRPTSGHFLEYVADGPEWRAFVQTMPHG
jgi:hypothetical protein